MNKEQQIEIMPELEINTKKPEEELPKEKQSVIEELLKYHNMFLAPEINRMYLQAKEMANSNINYGELPRVILKMDTVYGEGGTVTHFDIMVSGRDIENNVKKAKELALFSKKMHEEGRKIK